MAKKPFIIEEIENYYGLELSQSSSEKLKDFMAYGRKEQDKNQFLEKDGQVIGLNLRTNDLQDFPFLTYPELEELQALNISENKLTSITIPAHLKALEYIDLSDMETLKELVFDADLPNLKELDTSDSKIEKFDLTHCPKLERLDMSRNVIQSFSFDSSCPVLEWMDLSGNKGLKKLKLPKGFDELTHLYLSNCEMEELIVDALLPKVRVLDLKGNKLKALPGSTILNGQRINLYAKDNRPKNIPSLFLDAEDCWEDAKDWFEELKAGKPEPNKVIKLMITGNGNVGKTTLMCALKNENEHKCVHEEGEGFSTTHGVEIGEWRSREAVFNYWDFGGQEVYHGTHQLFLQSDAVQMIVFDSDTESKANKNILDADRAKGNEKELVRNYSVEYWYHNIKALSPHSQFLFVQNKKKLYPKEEKAKESFAKEEGWRFYSVDALDGYQVDRLPSLIRALSRELPEFDMLMPKSWLQVRAALLENLKEDKPQRRIAVEAFEKEFCKGINEKSLQLLRRYLHNNGYLYQHENLKGEIILDQRWALEAIYKPFDRRQPYYDECKDFEGKVKVSYLFGIFGADYTEDEKWLFLSFMESCGICFELNRKKGDYGGRSEKDIFIFPEFLPIEQPEALINEWKYTEKYHIYKYKMEWVNYQKIRSIITKLGRKTSIQHFWRNGIKITTPEGFKFKIELEIVDENKKFMKVFIEEKAESIWLESIFNEFSKEEPWEKSDDKGKNWKDFNLETWKNNQKEQVVAQKENLELDKRLPDQTQEVDEETRKQHEVHPVPTKQKLVLFVCSSPVSKKGVKRLDYGQAFNMIEKSYKQSKNKRFKEPKINTGIEKSYFRELLFDYKPDVLHIFMHNSDKNGLYFQKSDQSVDYMTIEEFDDALQIYQEHSGGIFDLIILDACNTEEHGRIAQKYSSTVVCTTNALPDEVGVVYAREFYKYYFKENIQNPKICHDNAVLTIKHESFKDNQGFEVGEHEFHKIFKLLQ